MKNNEKITRRTFVKKVKKLAYLTPIIYTFATSASETLAQGRGRGRGGGGRQAAALRQLRRRAARGNQRALQQLRLRLVSPP